ncbi:MAG: nitrophenyl compound nitroreductase subunit ArsF family protein [Bacteroidota bacterium]
MRKFIVSLAILVTGIMIGNAQTAKKEPTVNASGNIEAYYFHFNTRCVTCRAVEAEAKADIKSLYPGKITFKAVNLDEASSKAIADKLGISGQTLIIVKGEKKIILTNEGFMYATTNPAKFKSIIKQKVDNLIAQ